MGYINIVVGSDAKISIRNKQLLLTNLTTSDTMDYPLEDINAIVIESLQSVISTKALMELADHSVAVYFCDEYHLPSAQLLNYNGFYKHLQIYNIQTACPKPFAKRIWRDIVCQKIVNQGKVLQMCNKNDCVSVLSSKVLSGDSNNIESVAALKYFKELFGKGFARGQNNIINSALDYGYSIIRGAIARSVVAHGLVPYLGVHHCNQLNAFNLVDDLIEPFRPVVDLYAYTNITSLHDQEMTRSIKQDLVGLLNADVLICNKRYPISYAIELLVTSLIDCMSEKDAKLNLPTILPLEIHRYE